MSNHHFLVISLPAQGHLNPTLQFAKNLARGGTKVTFATTTAGLRRITTLLTASGLSYATFSDGNDDGPPSFDGYMARLKHVGTQTLTGLIQTLTDEGRPVTFLVYTVLLPWAAEVACDLHLPSAFLAIQSATTFAIYHRFFNSHDGLSLDGNNFDPLGSVKLPGLPPLTKNDIPSFLLPTNQYYSSMNPTFKEHIQNLEQDPNPCVLVNTFDALEEDSISVVDNSKIKMISIGPLVPSAFCDGHDLSDTAFGCDLLTQSSRDYIQWLDRKPDGSVIYVSFGSMVVLKKRQKEEILQGLVGSGRNFLWVIREDAEGEDLKAAIENELKGLEGLIVPWCSQVEVLCHRSIGCFLTHCGWNSTVESMVAGVPVVGYPQFSDQMTNAKMVEEVWRNGVRMEAAVDEEGEVVLGREEIRRCLDVVMGSSSRGKEIRKCALKWKDLAMQAVKEGGSSYNNLKQFLGS